MNVEIHNNHLTFDIHGFSGTAMNKDYAGTAFKLMDKMWQTVKANNLKTKGLMSGFMNLMIVSSRASNLTSRQHAIWDWNKKALHLKSTPTINTSGLTIK
jgi:hypothetical protein